MALVKETTCILARLSGQFCRQTILPVTLLQLLQMEYTDILQHVLERRHRVEWLDFDGLKRALATGDFLPETVTIPGYLFLAKNRSHPHHSIQQRH